MRNKKCIVLCIVLAALGLVATVTVWAGPTEPQAPLGTGFTYQGRLLNNGSVISGTCDFAFSLWDAETLGAQAGSTQTVNDVEVTDGYFTVQLNDGGQFGADAFTGDERWLQVAVQCSGDADYTTLGRQELTAAPYAHYAQSAPWSGLTDVPSGFADGVDNTSIVVSGTNVFAGQGLDQLSVGNSITLSVAPPYCLPQICADGQIAEWDDAGSVWVCGDDDAGGSGAGWSLTGNAGTDPSVNFLGTTDAVSLTLAVNGATALRLAPTGSTPSLIGGDGSNSVSVGVTGATIGGGRANTASGTGATVGGGDSNQAAGNYAVIGGGDSNETDNYGATVGGGGSNVASGYGATISGGQENVASAASTTVGGGMANEAGSNAATVSGGESNIASGGYATVGGGYGNFITPTVSYATIGGGAGNQASGWYATVGGGDSNTASGHRDTIGGGTDNIASGPSATIGGGEANWANDAYATVSGGAGNTSVDIATVGGGHSNTADGNAATIGGGYDNTASGTGATIGGGGENNADGNHSAIGGGQGNTAGGAGAFVGGGGYDGITYAANEALGDASTIGGGHGNLITPTASYAAIGGGQYNQVTASDATIGGGEYNVITVTAGLSTIGGGTSNEISGAGATIGGGVNNTVSTMGATVPGGMFAAATHYGEMAYASGPFAVAGDAQTSIYVARNTTTNATPTELFLDGADDRITLESGRTLVFDILIVARSDGGDSAGYQVHGVIENVGGTTAFVGGTPSVTTLGEDDSAWNAAVLAYDSHDALGILITGSDNTNIQWVASVRTAEVAW
jgi:hypothetical protein